MPTVGRGASVLVWPGLHIAIGYGIIDLIEAEAATTWTSESSWTTFTNTGLRRAVVHA